MSDRSPETVLQHRTLETLRRAGNYNRWIAELVRPHVGDDPLELGSGLGELAAALLASGIRRLAVSERDPRLVAELRTRFASDDRVTVCALDVLGADVGAADHSAALLVNVLEHIQDDARALAAAAARVRAGGAVVVLAPAHPWATGRLDDALGHCRRYTAASLSQAFRDAGLELESVRHVNAFGLFVWAIGARLPRTAVDAVAVEAYDRILVPASRVLERHVTPPFGQSLLAVARVGGTSDALG